MVSPDPPSRPTQLLNLPTPANPKTNKMPFNNKKPLDGFELISPYSDPDLHILASKQLRPYPLPPRYLEELRGHLDFFPDDYLFQVIPRAGQGYGVVKCLEPGCSTVPVVLAQNSVDPDGGRSTGFGALAQYQAHVLTDEFHETLRDSRIKKKKQQAPKPSFNNTPSSPPSKINLSASDHPDLKPTLSSSAATTPSMSSKRLLKSPSKSSREPKKSRTQENSSRSGEVHDPIVIDVDSFDITSSNTRTDSKPKPIVIDVDSPDSEISVVALDRLRKNKGIGLDNDQNTAASLSDEDKDTIWVAGKGEVPLAQFAKPKFSTHPSPESRLSTAIRGASKSSTNDTQPQTLLPPIDRKSLEQAFDLMSDKAIPRNRTSPFASSSTMDTRPLPGHLSRLTQAVARLTDDSSQANNQYEFFGPLFDEFPNRNCFPPGPSDSDWGQSSGLLDWHPRRPMGMGGGGSSETIYEILSRLPDVIPIKGPVNMSMPYQEPNLRPEELQDFYKRAVENINFSHNATVAEAREALGISEDENAKMEGLTIRLMPHQLIAVSWMIAQEKSKNSGGILGDEMGLGKTIQMIATMVKNSSENSKKKATLILAPLALLTQWREEIVEKTSCNWKVMIYHQSFTKATERKKIAGNDVVITTLDTLRGDWDDDSTATSPKKPRGLFSVEWYRVVIDEAQIIRNRAVKKSRAVCALKATYRWCLTGTPIFNSLWDIYPYLRFLRIRPYNDMGEFRDHVAKYEKKHPHTATQRAQAILATCMLRRQKDSKLDGQPLITLPPKKIEDIMLDLSPEERDVYDMLEKKAQNKFNSFLKKGTVLKNFASILVLLLRLRQACGHPSLTIEDSKLEPVDNGFSLDPVSELERAVTALGQDWVDNIKKKFQTEAEELVEAEQKNPSQAAAPECPICNDLLDYTSRITKCGHVFCQACIETLLAHSDTMLEEDRNADPKKIEKPCPNCRRPFRITDTYIKKAFLPVVEEPADDDDGTTPLVRRKMRNGVVGDSDNDEPSSSSAKKPSKKGKEKATIIHPEPELVPSTKMVWLFEEIVRVSKECPSDKIIVISQWTAMLSLCADFLRARGHRYVHYQGSMKNFEREEAILTFKKKKEISIMLMSLKCGGVGLNLTCANRVISLDLAWSPASERQAFDRTHRLGQVKDVFVKRVMIRNTVEQRIANLQSKKQDITDNALGEGSGKKLQRITVGELASLFNLNVQGNAL